MRVVITGGTGLIGRALSASLAADGHEVIVPSRSPQRALAFPDGVRVVRWDARTAQGWGELVDGADAIVNLAGQNIFGRWTAEYKRRIRESRLEAGQAVVEAVEQAKTKPKVVVQASGVGYYGPRGDEIVTEDASAGEGYLGRTAVAWEGSTAPVEGLGVQRAIARIGIVLSTKGGALPKMLLPFRLFVGGRLGDGSQWFPWIHIADAVRALRFLMENDRAQGPFNLAAPNPLTNAQFTRALGRVLGRPSFLRVPSFAVRLVFGEMSTLVLDGQRAVPRHLEELGFDFRFPQIEAALEDLLGG